MSPIIAQPSPHARPNPGTAMDLDTADLDTAARLRRDRLARATADQMESALAFLSMIDPQAFEIAFTAVTPPAGEIPEDEEPFPVCRDCGAPVGIFLAHGSGWQHFRGDGATSGAQELYDPGHPAEVAWLLPGGGTAPTRRRLLQRGSCPRSGPLPPR